MPLIFQWMLHYREYTWYIIFGCFQGHILSHSIKKLLNHRTEPTHLSKESGRLPHLVYFEDADLMDKLDRMALWHGDRLSQKLYSSATTDICTQYFTRRLLFIDLLFGPFSENGELGVHLFAFSVLGVHVTDMLLIVNGVKHNIPVGWLQHFIRTCFTFAVLRYYLRGTIFHFLSIASWAEWNRSVGVCLTSVPYLVVWK